MRTMKWLLLILTATYAYGQLPQTDAEGVYSIGDGVKQAKLLEGFPARVPESPELKGLKHVTALRVVIGADAHPQEIFVLNRTRTAIDDEAIAAVRRSRFEPGKYKGAPVATRLLVYVPFDFGSGREAVPETGGVGKLKNFVPALPLITPAPGLSDEARAGQITGNVLIDALVTEDGLPTELHVVAPLGHGLDEEALEAVKQYRFRPATLDGVPIPSTVSVNVQFPIIRYRK